MTNYSKYGEFVACKKQAQDAAAVRRAYLTVLADKADSLKINPSLPVNAKELYELMNRIKRADDEMRAAIEAANQAAALCSEAPLKFKTFELR